MALADQTSGDPPAVTSEMLEVWRKLADDVTAALGMGGDAGMTLLDGVMAEWCEAVDDVNTAREICVRMAAEGRRHEAIEWHADGFFEVADRLSPERPGWEEWAAVFAEQGKIVPRVDHALKEMADRIFEDLLAQDLAGRSLADHTDALRRNILARGHFGERLTILQDIRAIDPAGSVWEEMLQPIRARRAGEIEAELAVAVNADDFPVIERLQREVASGDWGQLLPAKLATVLNAAVKWQQALGLRRPLADAAAELSSKAQTLNQLLHNGAGNAVTFPATLNAALQARVTYESCSRQLMEAMAAARRVPAIESRLAASGVAGTLEQSGAAVRGAVKIIDGAKAYWAAVQTFREWEADVEGLIHSAPLHGGRDWDEIKNQCQRWLDKSAAALVRLGKLQAKTPIERPNSTSEVMRRLDAAGKAVKERIAAIRMIEKRFVVAVVVGVLLLVVTIVTVLVLAAGKR